MKLVTKVFFYFLLFSTFVHSYSHLYPVSNNLNPCFSFNVRERLSLLENNVGNEVMHILIFVSSRIREGSILN